MRHTSNLFYFLILGSCAAQWTIDFNDDGLCNGTDLGRKTIDLDETTCYDDYAGSAVGVLVNTTESREQVVAFYQTPGCYTEDIIAASNTPLCVGALFYSFKVINTYNDPSGCCLDPAYFQGNFEATPTAMEVTRATTITTSITSSYLTGIPETASAAPISGIDITLDPLTPRAIATRAHAAALTTDKPALNIGHDDSFGEPQIYHGVIRVYANERFKMHQLAYGVYTGIPLEDWDDSVHVKNDERLDLSEEDLAWVDDPELTQAQTTSLAINPLDPRLFKYATCEVVTECVWAGVKVVFGIWDGIQILVAAISKHAPSRNQIWKFLNSPYVVQIVGGAPVSGFTGWITARTMKSSTSPSVCSDQGSEEDTLKSALLGLHGMHIRKTEGNISDLTLSFRLPNGEITNISINARVSWDTTPEVCGAGYKADSK